MTQPRTARIPAPLYAVAGAGELAYQQLRRLPAVVSGLGDEATRTELREKAVATTAELRDKAALTLRNANSGAANLRHRAANGELDLDRLREATIRNAAVVVAGAQAAQERAVAVYGDLVARGERVVGSGVVQAADTVNADITATEAPAVGAPAQPVLSTTPAEVVDQVKEPAASAEAAATAADTTPTKAVTKRRPAAKSTRPATKRTRPATDE
ncbi:hypothetical protein [Plantactinospora endophytica]|uniref:Uncharacterized protein n=1 Tax=Plantactinospora endophytica TaxID=673535 RepID=A0ABQ4DSJ1_9ACTN|nr:hypothetical protein [Plantactinospora endophytica]GIG85435.1 hypothetical protein Pen02_03710 [Plantactinospora endophytica]